ncbi:MAG: gliding motility-associated C-terminal domain-containing protein [Bacteroidia bacterium]
MRFITLLAVALMAQISVWGQSKVSVTITKPSEFHLCIVSDLVDIEVRNITTGTVTGLEVQLDLPTGVQYDSNSVLGVGISEKNVSNLSKPIFSVDDLAFASSRTLSFKLKIDCSVSAFLNGGGIAQIKSITNYTGGSVNENSTALNIKQPSLQIQSISKQLYTADVGEVFVREIKLKNSGTGKIAQFELRRIYENGLIHVGTSGKTNQSSLDTFWTFLDSSDIVLQGNYDKFLDLNEEVVISDTMRVDGCNNLGTDYSVAWGCYGVFCDVKKASANVSISNKNPDIVFTPRSYTSNCLDKSTNHLQELIIYNKGDDTARQFDLHLFQSRGTGFSIYVLSEMDYNSFRTRTSLNGATSNIIPYKASNGAATGIYACLNSNSVGEAFFNLGNIAPGDSVIMSWNSISCCPTICNASVFISHRWKFESNFKDQCDKLNSTPEGWGSYGLTQSVVISKFTPTDILDGQTKRLEYSFSNGYLLRPRASSQLTVELVLPSGLSHSLLKSDIEFRHPNGSNWQPDYFSSNGDTVRAFFNGVPKVTLTRGELLIDIKGDCGSGSGNKDVTYDFTLKYNPDTTCSSNCAYKVYCTTDKIKVHCATSCSAGLHFNDFEAKRVNYGLPDANNDGIADASGNIDLDKIKTHKVMVGDTLVTTFRADVGNAGSITNWYHGKATSKVTFGSYLKVEDVRIKIYRNSGLLFNCNNIIYSSTTVGTTQTFTFDIGYTNLTNSGCVTYSTFSYLSVDSIELEVTYVVDQNPGNAERQMYFDNDFYLSSVASPTSSQKYQCDSFSAKMSLIGYYFTNYGRNLINASGCSDFYANQNFYLSVGRCCTNYGGGNIFPYEYRPWAKLNEIIFNKPAGFDVKNGRFIQYRTAGTGAVGTQRIDTISPSTVSPTSINYRTDSLYEDLGGPILISDDGFHGTFTATLEANCLAQSGAHSLEYGFVFEKLAVLGGGLDTLYSNAQDDQVNYAKPEFNIIPKDPYIYAESDTVEWDVRVINITANSAAENVWIGAQVSPNVELVEVIDLKTNTPLVKQNDLFLIGPYGILEQKDYRLRAVYKSCATDSVKLELGFDCRGYTDSIADFPCNTTSINLYYEPINTRLEANILDSTSQAHLCEDQFYNIQIRNTGAPKVFDVYLDMLLRPGMILKDTAWLFVDGRADSTMITNPVWINGNTKRWNISSQDSLLLNLGMNGVKSSDGYVLTLRVVISTDCDFTSSTSFLIKPGGYLKCGTPVNAGFSIGDPIDIIGVTKPYFSSLAYKMNPLEVCEFIDSTYVSFINLGPDTTGHTDQIIISLPEGITIDTNFLSVINQGPTSYKYEFKNGENVFSYKLPSGITVGDSSVFYLKTQLSNTELSCETQQIFVQAVIEQSVLCVKDSSYCDINVATSSVVITDTVKKAEYALAFGSATSIATGNNETVSLNYDISNVGLSKRINDLLVVDLILDQNGNGLVDPGDSLLLSDSVWSAISSNSSINRVLNFDVLSNKTCDLLLSIDSTNCACETTVIRIPFIQLLNAGPDTLACPGVSFSIGQAGNAFVNYSWNNGSFLSDSNLSRTVFTGVNTTTSQLSIEMVLLSDKGKCSSSDTMYVTLNPGMQLNLVDSVKMCKGSRVLIGDPVIGGVGTLKDYVWSPIDSLSRPTGVRTYANPTVSTMYKVQITDDSACVISDSTYVEVIETPLADFELRDTCANSLVSFKNTSDFYSEPVDSVLWTFGSLSSSQLYSPSVFIDSSQFMQIELYIGNSQGCWDTTTKTLELYPLPNAAMEIRDDCEGDTSLFKALSTIEYGSLNHEWLINGDNFNSNQLLYTLPLGNAQEVLLKVWSDKGCYDQLKDTIVLFEKPLLDISAGNHCFGDSITISGAQLANDALVSYQWLVNGVAVSQSQQFNHLMLDTGIHNILFMAETANSCRDTAGLQVKTNELPISNFVGNDLCLQDTFFYADRSTISNGSISQVYWDLGSGFVLGADSSFYIPISQGLINLGQKVISDNGCLDSSYQNFNVHFRERADLITSGNCVNELINLRANPYSADSVSSVSWTVDGFDLSGLNVNYLFPSSGVYNVNQIVTTNRGCTSSNNFNITVDPAPTAVLGTELFCNDNQVRFSSNSTNNQWSLGDGNVSSLANFVHDYASVGSYPVELIVTNQFGCKDTATQLVVISNIVIPEFSIENLCEDEKQWVVNLTSGQGVPLSKAEFDMGNGDLIQSFDSFEYAYNTAGTYDVKLTVTTSTGCDYDTSQQLVVHPLPTAGFSFSPVEADIFNSVIVFTDESQGADQLWYLISDGGSYQIPDFSHEFLDSGSYSVKQWVNTQFGCSDSITKEVYIRYAYRLHIPNVFTPNQDGLNESFKPVGIGLKSYELEIYNRWGELIFRSLGPNDAWDGQDAIQGYYLYNIRAIDFEDNVHSYKGGVYLLK